ncbi:hyaluronoglucosaminidase 6 isoform X1 [Hippoglossus hippoglossus]|uniref:hyaluronoglucosaminidase 6 n=1 Tax=Hippoglossus stenolepis TaxID=195615 RepID=UPI00148DD3F6|nr:hyaluronoglucosaminidase 6 isoform X1 [Hippoglossus hippoglossus]XP_035011854.1 hyaluronoglucosaminidase 6 [Hippoglossus stenolepis]XP_035011855.1 hyaluronoglucosaminidase 6 [Hippoglossus stenolepis]
MKNRGPWHRWGSHLLAMALWVGIGVKLQVGGDQMKPARAPLIPHRPFVVVWNAPTESCRLRFKVDLDLSVFDIVANLNETLSGPNVTIFYHSHLGYYPYYSNSGFPINGGLPQNQSISKHLSKARTDIDKLIPHKDFRGLGVIDWENWRPQWVRNWGSKDIYRNKSKDQIRKLHPNWPESKVEKEAKESFERAGQDFMNLTLALAEGRRPNGLWGFYLFPDCYNYGYKQHPQQYTGECPNVEHVRNDHLMWLWKESSALYPSIYLDYELKSSPNTVKFVHYRVKEAMRIASIARTDFTLPVFVYSRPFYAYTFVVLSESDLLHTIGESAALGASGVVLWGSSEYSRSQRNCLTVKKYIDGPLGHYVINVTSAAKLCSKALCKKNGRCVRKSLDSNAYLHLNPRFFHIHRRPTPRGPHFHVSGHLNNYDILDMKNKFTCQCYQGWTGVHCEMPQTPPPLPPPQPAIPLPHPHENSLLGDILLLLSLHFSCLCIIIFLGLCLIIKCLNL